MKSPCFLNCLVSYRSISALALAVFAAFFPGYGTSLASSRMPGLVLGVGTHLQGGGRELASSLDRLSTVGAGALRDDAPWRRVEEERGELRIPGDWDRLVNGANARGIKSLFILDYGNRFYGQGARPTVPANIAAFARYAAFVAEHFKGRVTYYEIWNEWNHNPGQTQADDAASYVLLARSVYHAVKEADPRAMVLAGAVTPDGIRGHFLARVIRLGLLDHADGLSLHTYIHCRRDHTPEDWAAWMKEVEHNLKQLAGQPVPFYITEMGWPSYTGACGISPDEQGRFLARMFLLARTLPFIRGIWWYDLKNDGADPNNREDNFGLLDHDMTPKPAYEALKAIAPLVREGRYVGKFDTRKRSVHILRFLQSDAMVLAMWEQADVDCPKVRLTSAMQIRAKLETVGTPLPSALSVTSRERRARVYTLDIPLSGMPRLLSLPKASVNVGQLSVSCVPR